MKGRKKMKKVKKLTIILAILLICLVSFIGIYIPKNNVVKNIVKNYSLAMNLNGYRELRMQVAENQEVTSEKVQHVKDLMVERLKLLGAEDYLIKVDYTTGEIVLELAETTTTDRIVADIYNAGELKMVDSEDTSKVLMTNEHIKKVSVKYSTSEAGTGIYLDFEFTEEGSKIIEDLSLNAYKTIEKEKNEENGEAVEGETEEKNEEVVQPKLTLMIDDTKLVSSSFDYPITEGRLQLSLTAETKNEETIQQSVNSGNAIATILNNGPLPIKYQVSSNSNTYIYSEITDEIKMAFIIAIATLILIAFIVLVIKYKMPAVFSGISYIGFVALYLLVLRYANVTISLEGVVGIIIVLIINYLLIQKLLTKSTIIEALKEMGIQLIPVVAVIIVFSFIRWTNIASFGMTMFWGLVLSVIYNFIVTKALLEK